MRQNDIRTRKPCFWPDAQDTLQLAFLIDLHLSRVMWNTVDTARRKPAYDLEEAAEKELFQRAW